MPWIPIIISAYLIFAVTSLVDNYLLLGAPNPKSYSFYVGVLGILVLVLIPFIGFSIPPGGQIILALSAGVFYILAMFWFYFGLEYYTPSQIVPVIGALTPIFTFILINIFLKTGKSLSILGIIALAILIGGSFLASFKKGKKISFSSLKIAALSAFLFSLTFLLSKEVYENQPFWSGFIWMRIGGFFAGFCFLFTKEVRREIFQKKFTFKKRTGLIFILNQGAGAGGFILQNFAIALAGLIYLPFINALLGVQFAAMFFITFFLIKKFPKFSEEKFTPSLLSQKIASIVLIAGGLLLFYLL